MSEREPVTLEFLACQLDRMLADLASLRDDVNVLTAIVQRLDNSHTRLLGTVNLSGQVSRIDVAGKVVQKFIANPHCRFRPRSGISRCEKLCARRQ